MTAPLRIALAQFDFAVGAVAANAARMRELAALARDLHRADVIVFPELALSGCPPLDLVRRDDFLAGCDAALDALTADLHGIIAVVGHPQMHAGQVFNTASVLGDGKVLARRRKCRLADDPLLNEAAGFTPGDETCVFELGSLRIGVLVGTDLCAPAALAELAAAGAHLVLAPCASAFELGRATAWHELLVRQVSGNPVALACVNIVGGEDDLVFDGGSVLIDADGTAHPPAKAFSEQLLIADFDPANGRFSKQAWQDESDAGILSLSWRALVRATADYVRKNGFQRVWVGLSGGLDSALVLAIAVDALGADRVTAVRLPSRHTSALSDELAAEQARILGVQLETVPIEAPFRGFLEALAPVFGDRPVDVTEENLQARCRGTLLMALANKFGGLLLTTSNKSEIAVGYGTLYGDMCGGFAPLKDVYKSRVFELARWRNGKGAAIPQAVIDRPPSAELRENQADTDSLPPYDVLDDILQRAIEQEQTAADIIAAGHAADTVERVLGLLRRSEFKRRQAAPGPSLAGRAFDPARRYPLGSAWG